MTRNGLSKEHFVGLLKTDTKKGKYASNSASLELPQNQLHSCLMYSSGLEVINAIYDSNNRHIHFEEEGEVSFLYFE